jgi:hypothetical protein
VAIVIKTAEKEISHAVLLNLDVMKDRGIGPPPIFWITDSRISDDYGFVMAENIRCFCAKYSTNIL